MNGLESVGRISGQHIQYNADGSVKVHIGFVGLDKSSMHFRLFGV